MKTYYHIRTPNGVTLDWREDLSRTAATEIARDDRAELFEVRGGIATLIYSPPAAKAEGP